MSEGLTLGARYAAADIEERLALDREARQDFEGSDRLLAQLIRSALNGDVIAEMSEAKRRSDLHGVKLLVDLDEDETAALADHFAVAKQEKRGSWHIPANERLSLGLIHMVYWLRRNPRLAVRVAPSDGVNPAFAEAPQAVALWVLEPLFEQLYLPIKLRSGRMLGRKTVEQQEKQWALIDPLYEALGIDTAQLDPYRPGRGFHRLNREEINDARIALIDAWSNAPKDVGDRYRAYRIGELVERYYSRAKNGQATRKQVLTAAYGRTLTAYYGGDWLSFLEFLGEQPHSDEQIIQALPKTTILAGTSERAAEVAAGAGVTPEQVKEMLAAYWQQETTSHSPIEQRVHAIRHYWDELDQLHANQRIGMATLAPLSEPRGHWVISMVEGREEERKPEEALSADLHEEVNRLWATEVLARYPDRLVSQVDPIGQLALAIGPALRFWAQAALTAWYMAVGPMSRTTLGQLGDYLSRDLDELEDLGFPIPKDVLRELAEAEEEFGPESPLEETLSESEIELDGGPSLTFSMTMSHGITREGYEPVRDIITRLRHEWTERYWDGYLRARWDADLRTVGDRFHRETAKRGGKPPTFKAFGKHATRPANVWFAGRIPGVYAAIGATAPPEQTSDLLMPKDRKAFATEVFTRLGGKPRSLDAERQGTQPYDEKWMQYVSLANESLGYVQHWEALGEPPELKQLGSGARRFEARSNVLDEDVDRAFEIFGQAVSDVLAVTSSA